MTLALAILGAAVFSKLVGCGLGALSLVYAVVVFMAVATTLIALPLLKMAYREAPEPVRSA